MIPVDLTRRARPGLRCGILAALLIAPVAGSAQSFYSAQDTTIHLLDIPAGSRPFRCQEDTSLPDSLVKLGQRSWEFSMGGPLTVDLPIQPRNIIAHFDSSGQPLVLSDIVTLPPRPGNVVVVIFAGTRQAWGRHYEAPVDNAMVGRAHDVSGGRAVHQRGGVGPQTKIRDITAGEERRARDLMHWLWNHRCGVHSSARN